LKIHSAIAALMVAVLPQLSAANVADAVNFARMQGCGPSAARTPLYAAVKLQQAAKRYAGGATLQNSLADSGYLAAQSAAIHLSGPASDDEIERMLAAHECRALQDPRLREFGAERRGRDLWLMLAAPVALPDASHAASVTRGILDRVNEARAAGRRCGGKYFGPAAPLALDAALARAALEHSRDMAVHDAFDHRGQDGSTPGMRVARAGFGERSIVGENIAAGALTPNEVMQGWLASPEHCENIMDGRFTLIGIAYAENLHSRSAVFWTQDFAAHR
jgi:uncharacterized protein YkwD